MILTVNYFSRTESCNESTLVAVVQLSVNNEKDANFNNCKDLVELAVKRGAKVSFWELKFNFINIFVFK